MQCQRFLTTVAPACMGQQQEPILSVSHQAWRSTLMLKTETETDAILDNLKTALFRATNISKKNIYGITFFMYSKLIYLQYLQQFDT